MVGQMAIAIALPGCNDLGHYMTPTKFSFQEQILFTILLSPHCPQISKK